MHIFVADDHPRQRPAAVRGAHERSKPYGFSSRRDGARATWSPSDVSVAGAAKEEGTLRNRRTTIVEASGCPASAQEGPATSNDQLTRRHYFGWRRCFSRFRLPHSTAATKPRH
jgi:hypothetical protein